jgi:hypothetical protein
MYTLTGFDLTTLAPVSSVALGDDATRHRLIAAIHVEIDSGKTGGKKTNKKASLNCLILVCRFVDTHFFVNI